ncbi:hypothetical protein COT29_01580 [Candidatus Micrarchaeota archaeon CG08_land_8_20_14_0_20_59_11]|nr:MAG: hypothetical protein COT29_01580 [Candidatus Micrarchaeota archaeon CG08_land_8_20_14_0_20_59_11]
MMRFFRLQRFRQYPPRSVAFLVFSWNRQLSAFSVGFWLIFGVMAGDFRGFQPDAGVFPPAAKQPPAIVPVPSAQRVKNSL